MRRELPTAALKNQTAEAVQQFGHQHLWCSDVIVLLSTFAGEGGMILMIEWKAIWLRNTSLDIANVNTRNINA